MGIQRTEHLIDLVKSASVKKIADICIRELDYMRDNYKTISSLRSAVTDYRNAIRKSDMPDDFRAEALRYFKLTSAETIEANTTGEKNLSDRLKAMGEIRDVDAFIEKGNELLKSSSYMAKILGLAVLTGRRVAELGCTARFEKIPGVEDRLMFEGQIKARERDNIGAYEIPVLGDVDRIIEALASIRESKPQYINEMERFHNATSKELNKMARKHFDGLSNEAISPKDLRPIYSEIVYLFADMNHVSKTKYFSMILGHTEDDNRTGVRYSCFYITDENYL